MENNTNLPGGIIINNAAISKPCILLIGPKSVGKTVTLIRLARYLESGANYTVTPNLDFRSDADYDNTCSRFIDLLRSTGTVPDPTVALDFLLVDIKHDGKILFHVLEAPGEHYFDVVEPNKEWFYPYFTNIMNKEIKKIFIYFFVQGFLGSDAMQKSYSNRLKQIARGFKSKNDDRVIFCLNKTDELNLEVDGIVDRKYIKDTILENPNYNSLKNQIRSLKKLEPVAFVPNSNGAFTPVGDGSYTYAMSSDDYPKNLWMAINKPKSWSLFGIRFG